VVDVRDGGAVDIGSRVMQASFGMVTGNIVFTIGNLSWVPGEIWLLPGDMDPSIFSKGLTQQSIIELPQNVTSSTCRTAVYYNQTSGYGFKVYNTGTTVQISQNGTFCGLAYNGTYFVFARY
jgi:hypothetical protein